MRLTIRTDLALRALMFCAVNAGRTVRKAEIAAACNASENHLGVVINILGQQGLLETSRGRNGGIRLERPADSISVGTVVRLFEGPAPFAECFPGGDNTCPLTPSCRVRPALAVALDAFFAALDAVTLEDLVQGNTGLERLLSLETV